MKNFADYYILTFLFLGLIIGCKQGEKKQKGERVDLIIDQTTVVTLDETNSIIDHGFVVINQKKILETGSGDSWMEKYTPEKLINGAGKVVMPGLINTHTHLAMTLFRGMSDDLPLQTWLQDHIWPAEAKYIYQGSVHAASLLAMVEMIRSGTTTFSDMYFFEEEVALAARQAGLRAVIGEGILDFPTPSNQTPNQALAYTRRLFEKWADDPLINISVAPHSPYTCSEGLLLKCRQLADSLKIRLQIHLSETHQEVADMVARQKMSPVAYLEKTGFLGPNLSAAHCVHLSDQDISLLKKHGIAIAHNPQSNMKLASGVAPVPRMLEAGLIVGLGTDGAASNNDLNLWEEINSAALIHKAVENDPTVMKAETVLRMATIDGARVLGLDQITGSIEAGKQADLIVMDMTEVHSLPVYDVYAQLVYSSDGSDVETVIVDGQVIMENRNLITLDEEEIIAGFLRLTDEIAKDADLR